GGPRAGVSPRPPFSPPPPTRTLPGPPPPPPLDGPPKALALPVSAVRAAAAESTGLHYYDEAPAERGHAGDPERELLIASIDELTPEDRRHVAALGERLRNRTEREHVDC